MRDILIDNTERFAGGLPANNALLWGARGMGKSSLVKAVHAAVARKPANPRSSSSRSTARTSRPCPGLIALRSALSASSLFCDDLSFDANDASYKSLKAVLEGGLEGRPENVVFYATSNRRHLMPREMIENERSTAIHPDEAVEEKVSLSDRFGLWLGFHNCAPGRLPRDGRGYSEHFGLKIAADELRARRPRMVDDPRQPLRPRRLAVHRRIWPGRLGVRLAGK